MAVLKSAALVLLAVAAAATPARADRIKDLTTIYGVRENHVVGFGLVVGLAGTGDDTRSPAVKTALTKMLKNLGSTIDPADLKAKNVAAVIVTGELPAFGKPGMGFDITVSSLGNSSSLAGGTLLATPLRGADGSITWAIAQGALSVGGFVASGASGSSTTKNHTTAGTVSNGAIIEKAAPTAMPDKQIVLMLKAPDFTTASRMQEAINTSLGAGSAITRDASAVIVAVPADARGNVPALIAKLEAIEVDPDLLATVIVDEKTGTIVVGEAVTLRPAAITFGALTVEVSEAPVVSQPEGIASRGKTKVVPRTEIKVKEETNTFKVMGKAATVADVAAALAALGAKPRDLVSILRALKASGALRADIKAM